MNGTAAGDQAAAARSTWTAVRGASARKETAGLSASAAGVAGTNLSLPAFGPEVSESVRLPNV